MSPFISYLLIFFSLLLLELAYFRIAERFNIVDKPNDRSSHSRVVLRGGGVVFLFGVWVWSLLVGFTYPWMLAGVTLAAVVSFVDDVRSLPDSVRLLAQFAAMALMFYELGILQPQLWWVVLIALVVSVGATNIFNFMDGINGITGAYSISVLVPLLLLDLRLGFIEADLIMVAALSVLVFCIFNFRPRNKARCFAGDVGSVSIAFILLFIIGRLILFTGDVTYLALLLVYGVDGCLTICHRIMLHEHLGQAHRKHAYQLMGNELKMSHVAVSLIYLCLQLFLSLSLVYLVPDTVAAHWIFLVSALVLLSLIYVLFMKKYYHLHAEYLASIEKKGK